MIESVAEYLKQLEAELAGCDRALIQDALSDAEDHLATAVEMALLKTPEMSEAEVLPPLIEEYGSPAETASAYRDIESRISPGLAPEPRRKDGSLWRRFFGVLGAPGAWGAFFYMLLSGLTGMAYGLWAGLGFTLSLVSLILVIGLPLTGLYLFSLRGAALLEGRVVEALLGIRMPRKPLFVQKGLTWKGKLKALVTESHTWKCFGYMILQLPLGLVYFLLLLVSSSVALKCVLFPFLKWFLHRPLLDLPHCVLDVPWWGAPLISFGGIVLLTLILHMAKGIGSLHGRYAKAALVRR